MDFNRYPYFDDFNTTKDFHRVLYRPSIPVQARELTQSQTILQNQIATFGSHIFANGARVRGGQSTLNSNAMSVKVPTTYPIDYIKQGYYIVGQATGMIGEVMGIVKSGTDHFVVYIPRGKGTQGLFFGAREVVMVYTDATMATVGTTPFKAADTSDFNVLVTGNSGSNYIELNTLTDIEIGMYLNTVGATIIYIDQLNSSVYIDKPLTADFSAQEVVVTNPCGYETALVGIAEGDFYINGFFVRLGQQFIVPEPRIRAITATIGLITTEQIVTSDDDSSLLDPSQGSYNYTAPGADRLKLTMTLVAYTDPDATKDKTFVEMMRVESGVMVRQNNYTEYSEIMKTMARRTHDESGNYVVSPFTLSLFDNGDLDNIMVSIGAGKAYVGGYEFETIAPVKLPIARSTDTETSTNFGVSAYVGNYLTVSSTIVGKLPVYGSTIDLLNGNGAIVGSAMVMQYVPVAGGMRIYLTNVSGSNVGSATQVQKIADGFLATITNAIVDSADKTLIFPAPQGHIKSIENISYSGARLFKNVAFSNGIGVIATNNADERFVGGSGVLSGTIADQYFRVVGTNETYTIDIKTVSANSAAQCEIVLGDLAFSGVLDVVAMVDVNATSGRIKTINQAGKLIPFVDSNPVSLGKADLYQINYASVLANSYTFKGKWVAGSYIADDVVYNNGVVYACLGSTSLEPTTTNSSAWIALENIKDNFATDSGQTEVFYDHATIWAANGKYNNLVVVFEHFRHSGIGPITVSSYPVDYSAIPSFGAYSLRDCIDIRPYRTEDSTGYSFDSIQLTDGTGFEVDIAYYLSRVDKLVLTYDRAFKVIRGVSSYASPLPPADQSDAMTMATFVLPPYTDDVKQVRMDVANNRRYTMKDIGKLDTRLTNIEYYTSLNSLESKVINNTFYSPDGTELFKSGFITDSFDTFTVGNVSSDEYHCSIDTTNGVCRPPFVMNAIPMAIKETLTTAYVASDIAMIPYTTNIAIHNTKKTGTTNVNPFGITSSIGIAKISPSSDYWFDNATMPEVKTNNENTRAIEAAETNAKAIGQSTQWGSWKTSWTGLPVNPATGYIEQSVSNIKTERYRNTQTNMGMGVVSSDNTVVINHDLLPFARANDVEFSVDGLIPNARVFVWVDDHDVTQFSKPAPATSSTSVLSIAVTNGGTGYNPDTTEVKITGGQGSGATAYPIIKNGVIQHIAVLQIGLGYQSVPTVTITGDGSGASGIASLTENQIGAPLIADSAGRVSGTLSIPNNESLRISTGTHRIIFTDSPVLEKVSSHADTLYCATGYVPSNQRGIVSTRVPDVLTNSADAYTIATDVTTRETSSHNYYYTTNNKSGQEYNYVYVPASMDSGIAITWDTNAALGMLTSNPKGDMINVVIDTINSRFSIPTSDTTTQSNLSVIVTAVVEVLVKITAEMAIQRYKPSVGSANFTSNSGIVSAKSGSWNVDNRMAFDIAMLAYRNNLSIGQIEGLARSILGGSGKNQSFVDPLAQSFVIDTESFPNGMFADSIDLFFASKDSTFPVIMEIRPMVNGFPSANTVVPLSTVVKYPADVSTSSTGTIATTFKFDAPVYLAPAEYAIVLKSGSNQYKVYIAEMQRSDLATNQVISQQPYIGNLFAAQNAATWMAETSKDLTFVINKCIFDTTKSYSLIVDNTDTPFSMDVVHPMVQAITPAYCSIDAILKLPAYEKQIMINTDTQLVSRNTLTINGDARLTFTMRTTDSNVSPIIDLERIALIGIQNVTSTKASGLQSAKYVMNTVTLAHGFNASNQVVYLNVNRPSSSSIEVYARLKNEFDTADISTKDWILLNQEVNGGITSQSEKFVEDKWSLYNFNVGGFDSFNQFEVKVVMYSTDGTNVPVISDIRGIALA